MKLREAASIVQTFVDRVSRDKLSIGQRKQLWAIERLLRHAGRELDRQARR